MRRAIAVPLGAAVALALSGCAAHAGASSQGQPGPMPLAEDVHLYLAGDTHAPTPRTVLGVVTVETDAPVAPGEDVRAALESKLRAVAVAENADTLLQVTFADAVDHFEPVRLPWTVIYRQVELPTATAQLARMAR